MSVQIWTVLFLQRMYMPLLANEKVCIKFGHLTLVIEVARTCFTIKLKNKYVQTKSEAPLSALIFSICNRISFFPP